MTDSHGFTLAKPYRCSVCGGQEGFRSRPRTLMERYILPLLLVRPVRCAECFHREYRLIFTSVRLQHHHARTERSNRNAA